MRILFTVPHYYDAGGGGAYGSLKPDPAPRRNALAATVIGLHTTLGRRQGLLVQPIVPSNDACRAEIDVVVCTTGRKHLVDALRLPQTMYRHHSTNASPRLLGFECHAVMREALGRYDYYCYLEDDLLIGDPLFFVKLKWFTDFAGEDAVLQPNRFEVAVGQPLDKLYIDGNLKDPEFSARLQDVADRPALVAEALGQKFRFQRVNNTHSGCFFLSASQMSQWAARPEFLNRDTSFVGPLESAASFAVTRFFRAYKPARENAGFLEIRHLDNRYLGTRIKSPVPRPAPETARS
jgi:hypothetical protein